MNTHKVQNWNSFSFQFDICVETCKNLTNTVNFNQYHLDMDALKSILRAKQQCQQNFKIENNDDAHISLV